MTGKTEKETDKAGLYVNAPQLLARCGNALTSSEKLVWLYLKSNDPEFNRNGVSHKLISSATGLTQNTVYKALNGLIGHGLVKVSRATGTAEAEEGKRRKRTGFVYRSIEVVSNEEFTKIVNTIIVNTKNVKTIIVNTKIGNKELSLSKKHHVEEVSPSTPSTEKDHSQETTTAAPSAVSGGEASGGAGGAAEPDGDVLDDVYQEFVEKRREGEFDRFLRYNRQRGWSMGAYDAAHEWLSKERPDRSRKPKAAGSGERLPESVAGAMEQVRAMCGRLAGVNEALARKAAGWFKLAGICCTANPRNTKAPAKLMESAREFLRRCPLFLDGEDAGFGEFVDSLVTK